MENKPATWAAHLLHFYRTLQPPAGLPNGIEWLYPQQDGNVMALLQQFLLKYYDDAGPRTLLLGINPGRLGAGTTGINFTAARQLTRNCGIAHHLKEQSELSAEFIYYVIEQYGGPDRFYRHFFIGSVCPLGFVQNGKNINYYDDKALLQTVEPFIVRGLEQLLAGNVRRDRCLCIGGDKNYQYLAALNRKQGYFKAIVPLPHPRFILQYRRRQLDTFTQMYLDALK